ncbi:hypothetical protein SAV31267_036920 [Streptomyces avermitilis]|uniref:PPM-type phosphatase domain-containing protein n=1 Tax=Streptomyces avermitilis TaxID=33903 RepID=A0A4D4MSU4_STRAX|nr:hypothetical protein SAV31267_036920 [Streptomyces avermitilis]
MAAGRERRAAAETFTARLKKQWHRARTGVRRSAVDYFRGDGSDWIALAGLLLTIPLIAATTLMNSVWCSPAALVLPIVAGGLLLRPSSLLGLYAAAASALIVESVKLGPYTEGPSRVTPGVVLVVAACGFFGLLIAQFRSRVGVPWRRGGTMLFDLRERIRVQSKLPKLPLGWHREMALRPAGGQSFSGDFVVAARTNGGRTLEVVLTDVSGKGMDAGSRALLLSGAFGGCWGRCRRTRSCRRRTAICCGRTGTRASRRRSIWCWSWTPGTTSCSRPGIRRGCSSVRAAGGGRRRPPRGRCSASTTARSSIR